ncbi:Crp/Fnr family transcriptional regulator [Burkholderia lata]|uniref:Crp/Fnr family transcriptional regulator n=1 Tax=Burkholderia lata (strain ATCC 17760 / DSM 23089 / LMG 22485 / NCIMB 9086 / R18194 / 383) TaxID=482957 RepID=A0A6P2KXE4_BURL3|nr:Crp/Fnr family transcriptional regulator [Burkholderia lata]VWB60770.1 Crp/Fnr family transcriptional regulator [Burkholderia lata]
MPTPDLDESLLDTWAAGLTATTRKALLAQSRVLECDTGHVLFSRGDSPNGFYTVLSGQVRFNRETASGVERLLTILGPGSTFGELASVSGRVRSHRAICDLPCRLWHIPVENFRALLGTHADFGSLIVSRMAERSQELFDVIEDQMLLDVPSRLAKRLVALARAVSGTTLPPADTSIRVTHEDLAKLIGASRQVVSSHLLTWQKQGLISQAYGNVHLLDFDALQRIGQDD